MLDALGFQILAYHVNEGHSALLTLQLLRRAEYEPELLHPGESAYDIPMVREKCHFTTHTPVEAGAILTACARRPASSSIRISRCSVTRCA